MSDSGTGGESRVLKAIELAVFCFLALWVIGSIVSIIRPPGPHKKTKAAVQINNLTSALKYYSKEYNTWPTNRTGGVPAHPLTARELNGLYQILIGNDVHLDKNLTSGNPRKIVFMEFKASELKDVGGGLTNIVDPWGIPYQFRLDDKGAGKVPIYGGPNLITAPFAIWSMGADRKDHPDPNHPDNADNICSWK